MSEVTVGAWNAHNSFGDHRVGDAIEVVKEMDSDVLYLCETTARDTVNSDYSTEASSSLTDLGYVHNLASSYGARPDTRDMHTMSLWSRVGCAQPLTRQAFGNRYGVKLSLDHLGISLYGVHLDDASIGNRLESADAILEDVASSSNEAVIMGDINSMNRADPKSFLPRALGLAVSRFEPKDFYNEDDRVQRLAGKVVRICRMASGQTVQRFLDAGFSEVDDSYTDTISSGRLGFQVDHILTSEGLEAYDFVRHDQTKLGTKPRLSDHQPISATIRR